jgi:hypothetical protein
MPAFDAPSAAVAPRMGGSDNQGGFARMVNFTVDELICRSIA